MKLQHALVELNVLQCCNLERAIKKSQQLVYWLSSLDALFPNKTGIIQHSIASTATTTPIISNFVTVNSISRNQLSFHQPSSGSERVIKFPVYTVNFDLTSLIAPWWLHWGLLQTASRNISSNDFQEPSTLTDTLSTTMEKEDDAITDEWCLENEFRLENLRVISGRLIYESRC